MRRLVTHEQSRRWARLYAFGWTLKEIAQDAGRGESTVRDALKREGAHLRRTGPKRQPLRNRALLVLWREGFRTGDIGRLLGLPLGTVSTIVWKAQQAGAAQMRRPRDPEGM